MLKTSKSHLFSLPTGIHPWGWCFPARASAPSQHPPARSPPSGYLCHPERHCFVPLPSRAITAAIKCRSDRAALPFSYKSSGRSLMWFLPNTSVSGRKTQGVSGAGWTPREVGSGGQRWPSLCIRAFCSHRCLLQGARAWCPWLPSQMGRGSFARSSTVTFSRAWDELHTICFHLTTTARALDFM